jgi:hypothetical protein
VEQAQPKQQPAPLEGLAAGCQILLSKPAQHKTSVSGAETSGTYIVLTPLKHIQHMPANQGAGLHHVAQGGPAKLDVQQDCKNLQLPHLLYWRIMFALRPAGGSRVIFMPFCRMLTGNAGLGMLVSHSRKSLCT